MSTENVLKNAPATATPPISTDTGSSAQDAISPPVAPAGGNRLLSLDAFRGLTVAFMILVSHPGSGAIYRQLNHAPWNGWTITDTIFPSFLWIVGFAITLSMGKRLARGDSKASMFAKVLRRSIILYLLGLLIYAIPDFHLATLRLTGVLQRIAICYLVAATLFLTTRFRTQIAWIAGLLSIYWIAIKLVPVPGYGAGNLSMEGNLAHYLDSMILGPHCYAATKTWDPEGLLSTLPALATTLLGMTAARLAALRKPLSERVVWLFVTGNGLIAAGVFCSHWLPINKNLWTVSFCLFMAGIDAVVFAVFLWLLDGLKWRWGTGWMLIYGMNALAIYVVSEILGAILNGVTVGRMTLHEHIFHPIFAGIGPPETSSLLYAIAYFCLITAFAWFLNRRKWYIKL